MSEVKNGDKLAKEVKNFVVKTEQAKVVATDAASVAEGMKLLEEPADADLDEVSKRSKSKPIDVLAAEHQSQPLDNIRLDNGLKGVTKNDFLGECADSVLSFLVNALSIPSTMPTDAELERMIKQGLDPAEEKRRQSEILKPKEDKFDLVYKLGKEQISLLSNIEKADKIAKEALAVSKVPTGPIVDRMKAAVGSSDLMTSVGGSIAAVLVVKWICVKLSHVPLVKTMARPLLNNRSTSIIRN